MILSLQLAAIAYMRSFSNRSVKLKKVRDLIHSKAKSRKNSALARADDSQSLEYFVEEFNDVLLALQLWRRSEDKILVAETSSNDDLKSNIRLIPPQKLHANNSEIPLIVSGVRSALEKIY